jgi:hypothetical protein
MKICVWDLLSHVETMCPMCRVLVGSEACVTPCGSQAQGTLVTQVSARSFCDYPPLVNGSGSGHIRSGMLCYGSQKPVGLMTPGRIFSDNLSFRENSSWHHKYHYTTVCACQLTRAGGWWGPWCEWLTVHNLCVRMYTNGT